MDDPAQRQLRSAIQERVRKTAPATLVGAALMLYFGYVHLARPEGADVFHVAALILYYTLRVGGVALALVAVLLYSGLPAALLTDAILAVPSGLLMAGCGIAMMVDGGDALNSVILILCGGSFVSSGWRNAQAYRHIAGHPIEQA